MHNHHSYMCILACVLLVAHGIKRFFMWVKHENGSVEWMGTKNTLVRVRTLKLPPIGRESHDNPPRISLLASSNITIWMETQTTVIALPLVCRLSLHPYSNIACANALWRLTHPLRIRHQRQHAHSITQHW